MISIWIFIGFLLIAYGALIMGQGMWGTVFAAGETGSSGRIARRHLVGFSDPDPGRGFGQGADSKW